MREICVTVIPATSRLDRAFEFPGSPVQRGTRVYLAIAPDIGRGAPDSFGSVGGAHVPGPAVAGGC
jgi:hypothetical protein